MKNTHDILAKNLESICTQEELDELIRYNNILELEEFVENNKKVEAVIGNTDLYPIYKQELQKKINKLR